VDVDTVGQPLSAVDLADALLGVAARRRASGLAVERDGDGHTVSLVLGAQRRSVRVDSPLGDALAVRLGLLAGIDPWAGESHLGRLRTEGGGADAEYLVVLRGGSRGFGVELRRVVDEASPESTAVQPKDAPLTQIGQYKVLGELGRGTMGSVYRCQGPRGEVAVKVLHPHIASDPRLAALFVSEGRAASQANDPGIVAVYDFGTLGDGRAYLVMELVSGETLEKALAPGPFTPRRAVRVVRAISNALQAAHVRGVIHRDLKPANVFLLGDAVKIADFGAAKVQWLGSAEEGSDVIVGTPSYMAPEHARGLETDERADVYALGCILFRCLSGRVPYRGRTLQETLVQQMSQPIPPLESPHGRLPGAAQKVLERCLALQPDWRYPSPMALATDLDKLLHQLGPDPKAA
jgi:serine/threonine-protein kinase